MCFEIIAFLCSTPHQNIIYSPYLNLASEFDFITLCRRLNLYIEILIVPAPRNSTENPRPMAKHELSTSCLRNKIIDFTSSPLLTHSLAVANRLMKFCIRWGGSIADSPVPNPSRRLLVLGYTRSEREDLYVERLWYRARGFIYTTLSSLPLRSRLTRWGKARARAKWRSSSVPL